MGRDVNMPAMQLHWDIFCRVIDNYGDIGVCWRLARQLAGEHGRQVRLWVDDLHSLQPLCPACSPELPAQWLESVDVRRWTDDFTVDRVGEVIIEAFACELPTPYLNAMAQAVHRPCWVNLEYLTAESWAVGCHGLASPHPTLPLIKHFFFPGFTPSTGGLLREADLPLLTTATKEKPLEISLFCYDTAPLAAWLSALAATPHALCCHIPPGQPQAAVSALLGGHGPWQVGQARLQPTPFLTIDAYDALLRRCTVNFVRGEDSFVRAQWAARPFIWQIYRQDDDAHLAKLQAFLDHYTAAAEPPLREVVQQLFMAWNTAGDLVDCWLAFIAQREAVHQHNLAWRSELMRMSDLSTALVNFCASKV